MSHEFTKYEPLCGNFLNFFSRLQTSWGGKFAAKNLARKMSTEPSCIFCQIAQRSAPAKILYEVSLVLEAARKTIKVPVVYRARDLMILMRAPSITRAIGRGRGPEIRDSFCPLMATSEASAIWAQKSRTHSLSIYLHVICLQNVLKGDRNRTNLMYL